MLASCFLQQRITLLLLRLQSCALTRFVETHTCLCLLRKVLCLYKNTLSLPSIYVNCCSRRRRIFSWQHHVSSFLVCVGGWICECCGSSSSSYRQAPERRRLIRAHIHTHSGRCHRPTRRREKGDMADRPTDRAPLAPSFPAAQGDVTEEEGEGNSPNMSGLDNSPFVFLDPFGECGN